MEEILAFLIYIFIEVLFQVLFYSIGCFTMKLLTFWQMKCYDKQDKDTFIDILLMLVGLGITIAMIFVFISLKG
jgi:hypothetical protein